MPFSALILFAFIAPSSAQLIGSGQSSFTENKKLEYEYNGIALTSVLFYISGSLQ